MIDQNFIRRIRSELLMPVLIAAIGTSSLPNSEFTPRVAGL